jgi:hypothetical protein
LQPSELGLLTSLIQLELHGNQLSGSSPSELALLTNLTYLMLFENSLTGLLPSGLGLLTGIDLQFFGAHPHDNYFFELYWLFTYHGQPWHLWHDTK